MRITLVYKLSLSAILLVLISTTVVGYLFYSKTTDLLVERTEFDIAKDIIYIGSGLQDRIRVQRDDVLFLASTPPIQGILRSTNKNDYDTQGKSTHEQWISRLENIFSNMILSKKDYLKIRYIDLQGWEKVVVRRDKGNIKILKKPELQDKSSRMYTSKTLLLPEKSVFVSDMNLNKEYGKVSVPHQKVLRTSTPVYNNVTHEVSGLILITSDIGNGLQKIKDGVHNENRKIYITNDHGGYLLHPDDSKSFGFDLGKRYRIQEEIPSLASFFLPENKDSSFLHAATSGVDESVINVVKLHFDPANYSRYITVAITEPLSSIVDEQTKALNEIVSLVVIFSMGVILFAIFFSYRLSKPIRQITQVIDDYANNRETKAIMPIHKKDEIGVLARSYEVLIGQVEEAQAIQAEMNRNLENLVSERTEKLELSEIYQRKIFENMVDGIITITNKGIIESFNPAAEKIFYYSQNDVIGKNVKMLMSEPYYSEHDGYLDNYKNTEIKKIIGIGRELSAQRKDGSIFPMELSVSEVTAGNKLSYLGVIRDISERKQMERMKNEFISTVSHELRTPLTSIRGSLGLLMNGVVGDIPKTAFDMLKIAGHNTDRLLFLINDILDIQKIESGQLDFSSVELELVSFVKQSLIDNASYGDQYDVRFELKTELDSVYISVDKDRLMQVMSNLLSNAAKFSHSGDKVEITIIRNATKIKVVVTDYGAGIPIKFQPKLFDKFTQSDSSDTKEKGGTGLGLSITKFIVEKQGGIIDFTSEEGKGTSFWFEFNEFLN